VTKEIEQAPAGYPGFLVMRPPRIRPTSATLKRVALAKLSDITLMSAAFGGERVLFEPWLTLLVDNGGGAFLTGVYRTDGASLSDAASEGPRLPIWCLRKSEWLRQTDLEQSSGTDDLGGYLSSGPQVATRLVFADRATHPELDGVMHRVLTAVSAGITVVPIQPRTSQWQFVDLDLADDRLRCSIQYSPLIARSESLEAVLPPWLNQVDELLGRDGLAPDGKVTLSIRRSVPELTGASGRSAVRMQDHNEPGWPARPPRPPRRSGPSPQATGQAPPGW
jgi:hypothetical protein